ncbi:MAG: SIMPL domain-containing protein [Holosporales bacterium]|nr:SIMPL domain-containing protein [Holosporales bacterium]
MSSERKNDILKILCFLLAVGLFYQISYRVVQLLDKRSHYISTNGVSDRVVDSDLAIFRIKINYESDKLGVIKDEDRKKNKDMVKALLHKMGIKEAEIDVLPGSISLEGAYSTNTKAYYRITDEFKIRTTKVKIVKPIISDIVNLKFSNGGHAEFNETYYYTDMSGLRIEMLEEASKDSRERAQKIAKLMNCKITDIKNMATGTFSIVPADSSADNEYRWDGQESIQKRVRVVVHGSFEMEGNKAQ